MSVNKNQVSVKEAVEREGKLLRTVSGSFSGSFRTGSGSRRSFRRRRNVWISVSIKVNNRRRRRT
jgi:hypothetical protein